MSKSLLYTALTTATSLTLGGIIPLGNTVRRFGCNIKQDGDTIKLCGKGYYEVKGVFTLEADSSAPLTVTLEQDGVPVVGALSTSTIAGTSEQTVLEVIGVVRLDCQCASTLSFVISSTSTTIVPTADNVAIIVDKK